MKALEIGEFLSKNHIDIVGGQERWELDNSKINVPGSKWFGKPSEDIKGKREERRVGISVSELSMKDVTIQRRVDRLQDKAIRTEYQAELGVRANDFFSNSR